MALTNEEILNAVAEKLFLNLLNLFLLLKRNSTFLLLL